MTSIISIYRRFPTKESCLEHLEKVRCKTCDRELPRTTEHFYKCPDGKDGLRRVCKQCVVNAAKSRISADPEKYKAIVRRAEAKPQARLKRKLSRQRRYAANPKKYLTESKERLKKREQRDPILAKCVRLRRNLIKRCRAKGFEIFPEIHEISFYEKELKSFLVDEKPACPCCKGVFSFSLDERLANNQSPSCDRINASIPTYRNNLAIICFRCNNIKRDATASELLAVGNWLKDRQ